MQLASDTVVVDLGKKAIMWNLIEGFFKVHNHHIGLFVDISRRGQILHRVSKLWFTRVVLSEAMLFLAKEIMLVKVGHNWWVNNVLHGFTADWS